MGKYKTLKETSNGEYREKGSRFIAFAMPCVNEEQAKEHINRIAKEHHKSKHVCYAYSIGVKNPLTKYSDAHEPTNTAGPPILNQIKKYLLNNVIVVVVRYFGGVLLGKGGLIRAYGQVAENAIINAVVIVEEEISRMNIECDYNNFPLIMDVIKKFKTRDIKQDFSTNCQISFEYNLDDENKIRSALEYFDNCKIL